MTSAELENLVRIGKLKREPAPQAKKESHERVAVGGHGSGPIRTRAPSAPGEHLTSVLPISAIQADEIRTIALRHGVERVRVGSVARGEALPESDLDLLIRLQPGHGFSDFMAFCLEVEAALGRRVDVVMEDGLSPYLRDRVLVEAISL